MDTPVLTELSVYIAPFFLCCAVVAAGIEAVKRSTWIWLERAEKSKPKWLRHAWRLGSILIGGATGLVMGVADVNLTWYNGFAVGCAAGVLSTVVFASLAKVLQKSE